MKIYRPIKLNWREPYGIIYKITNNINGKIYIGQTKNPLTNRINEHIKANNSLISRAIKKYGIKSFTIESISSAQTRKELCSKEIEFIQSSNCKSPNGYNLTDGGDGGATWTGPHTEKTKEILRIKNTGWKPSEETRKNMSKAAKNKPPVSEKTRKRMSIALKGKTKSKESTAKRGKIIFDKTGPNKIIKCKGCGKEMELRPNDDQQYCEWNCWTSHYISPTKGKKRPDLIEINKSRTGTKQSESSNKKKSLKSLQYWEKVRSGLIPGPGLK